MTSKRERIVERIVQTLTGQAFIGNNVFECRQDALSAAELPAISVSFSGEQTESFSEALDVNELTVQLDIVVRGQPFNRIADPIAAAAHTVVCADPQLKTLCARIRKSGAQWQQDDADLNIGVLSTEYLIRYINLSTDISVG